MILETIQDSDLVLSILSEEDVKELNEIKDHHDLYEVYRRKSNREYNLFKAKRTLFWEKRIGENEVCETSALRGKVLVVCKGPDNKLFVVEREKASPEDFFMDLEFFDDDDDEYVD